MLRPVLFHIRAKEEVRALPKVVRVKLGSALMAMQRGFNLGMPVSKPMPAAGSGVEELRVHDESGQYRLLYLRKSGAGILVLRAFHKKTRQTPKAEIDLARRRLKEMMNAHEQVGGNA